MDMTARQQSGRRLAFALCVAGAVIEGFDLQAASVTAASFAAELGMGVKEKGYAFTLNTLGLLVGAFFGGWLADLWSRKWVLAIAVATFGAFSLLNSIADDVGQFLLLRFLVGVGLGGALPNLIAMAAESGADETRARRVTVMTAGMPVGGAVVSAMVAFEFFPGWRPAFAFGGAMPILVAAAIALFVPDIRPEPKSVDAVEKVRIGALFDAGQRLRTLALWSAFFLTLAILYLVFNWLPSLLIDRGMDGQRAVIVSLFFNIFGASGSVALAYLGARIGVRPVFAIAYVGLMLSAGAMALLGNDPLPIYLAGGFIGVFLLGAQLMLYGLSADVYPAHIRGLGVGSAVSVGRLGAVAGPAVATLMLTTGLGPDAVLFSIVPTSLLALLAVMLLQSDRQ